MGPWLAPTVTDIPTLLCALSLSPNTRMLTHAPSHAHTRLHIDVCFYKPTNLRSPHTRIHVHTQLFAHHCWHVLLHVRCCRYVEIGMAVLPAIAIVAHFPAAPATPPSPAAAKFAADLVHGRVTPFFSGLWRVCKLPSLWLIVLAGGIQNGVSSAWQSVIPQVLGSVGYSPSVAGYYGFASTVAGQVGCIVSGRMADLYFPRRFKALAIWLFFIDALLFVWLTLTLPSPWGGPLAPNGALSIVSAITLAGFFQGALDPLFYELGAELTYPVSEGTSAGLYTFVYAFAQLLLLFISPIIDLVWQNVVMTGAIVLCGLLACLVREDYRRADAEGRMRASHKLDALS